MIPSWPTAGFTVTDFHFWNERYLYHERFDFYVIMPGSCKFKLQWLGKDKYKEWLLQGKDVRHAKCRVCQSQFDISSMGEAALTSHAKGQKHQHQLQSFRQTQRTNMTMSSFCRPSTSAAESESSQSSSAASASSSGPGPSQKHGSNSAASASATTVGDTGTHQPNQFAVHSDARKAEILWVLRQVDTHQSFRSSADSGNLFRKMFPDSRVAKQFSCGEQKCRYLAIYIYCFFHVVEEKHFLIMSRKLLSSIITCEL